MSLYEYVGDVYLCLSGLLHKCFNVLSRGIQSKNTESYYPRAKPSVIPKER